MLVKLKPRKETKKKMRPITKDAFQGLLKRAATTVVVERPVRKRALKSA
jgi:hypothetical protein